MCVCVCVWVGGGIQLVQKQGVFTQLNKALSVALYNIALSVHLYTLLLIEMSSVLTLAFKPDFC